MKLENYRYEEIKIVIADFLEDYEISELPIDVFELARKMNVKIVFASYLLKKFLKKLDEYLIYSYPHSYLYYNKQAQQFIVYIDDVGTKRKRRRFSLAHELMHIILGHSEQNERNESEANFGATYLLAPTSLVLTNEGHYLLDLNVIEYIFDVSLPEAKIIVRYNTSRLSIDTIAKDYETTINNLLKKSLISNLNSHLRRHLMDDN